MSGGLPCHVTQKRCWRKAGKTTLHNNIKCISINVYKIFIPGFTVLNNWRLFCKCDQEEIIAKGGDNHLEQKLQNSIASTGSMQNFITMLLWYRTLLDLNLLYQFSQLNKAYIKHQFFRYMYRHIVPNIYYHIVSSLIFEQL